MPWNFYERVGTTGNIKIVPLRIEKIKDVLWRLVGENRNSTRFDLGQTSIMSFFGDQSNYACSDQFTQTYRPFDIEKHFSHVDVKMRKTA